MLASSGEILAGRRVEPDGETFSPVRVIEGCIINDGPPQGTPWDDAYVDYNSRLSRVYYDSYCLKLLSKALGAGP
ncbi:MAG: hypothetical protein DRJ69_04840 [Thermoprotei archaeon]|nr:MAG: hypothetical protein DRJ69_04840 [Thermoprotei archaeon]